MTAFVHSRHDSSCRCPRTAAPTASAGRRTYRWPARVREVSPRGARDRRRPRSTWSCCSAPATRTLFARLDRARAPAATCPPSTSSTTPRRGDVAELAAPARRTSARHPDRARDALQRRDVGQRGGARARSSSTASPTPATSRPATLASPRVRVQRAGAPRPRRRHRPRGRGSRARCRCTSTAWDRAASSSVIADRARPAAEELPQADLHKRMAEHRAYLHPYRWTSLGLALLEAMTIGHAGPRAGGDRGARGGAGRGRAGHRRRRRPRRGRPRPGRRPGPGPRAGRGRPPARAASGSGSRGSWPTGTGSSRRWRDDTRALKIAMVSEHASPLAVLGGEDAGGQNVHVAALAMALADRGHSVEVFTRRDGPGLPEVVTLHPGVDVVHVPAGPARPIGKDSLPAYMPAFGSLAGAALALAARPARRRARPLLDVRPAALRAPREHGHPRRPDLPRARASSSGGTRARPTPARRSASAREEHLAADGGRRHRHLLRRGARAARARRAARAAARRAVRGRPRAPSGPGRPARVPRPTAARILSIGRLVERKGVRHRWSRRCRSAARTPSSSSPAAPTSASSTATRTCAPLRAAAARARRRRPGALRRPGRPRRRPGPAALGRRRRVPCPGTSRSGSSRWRRWRAGCPSSAPPSAACSTPWSTGSPGCSCRRATRPPRPRRSNRVLGDEELPPAARPCGGGPRRRAASAGPAWPSSPRPSTAARRARRDAVVRRPSPPKGHSHERTRSPTSRRHLPLLRRALADLERQAPLVERWGAQLAAVLGGGGRLLAAGNGGSAGEAQHLTAELVGRFETPTGKPLSAIALCAETSSLTAIGNDFGFEHAFARQVTAHGREGDVLVLLTTSGRSRNLVYAAQAGREAGLRVWAMTGPAPNPVAGPGRRGAGHRRRRPRPPSRRRSWSPCTRSAPRSRPGWRWRDPAAQHGLRRPSGPRGGGIGAPARRRRRAARPRRRSAPSSGSRPTRPCPSSRWSARWPRPGGAGPGRPPARRAAAREVTLACAAGTDAAGERLRALLAAAGVDRHPLAPTPAHPRAHPGARPAASPSSGSTSARRPSHPARRRRRRRARRGRRRPRTPCSSPTTAAASPRTPCVREVLARWAAAPARGLGPAPARRRAGARRHGRHAEPAARRCTSRRGAGGDLDARPRGSCASAGRRAPWWPPTGPPARSPSSPTARRCFTPAPHASAGDPCGAGDRFAGTARPRAGPRRGHHRGRRRGRARRRRRGWTPAASAPSTTTCGRAPAPSRARRPARPAGRRRRRRPGAGARRPRRRHRRLLRRAARRARRLPRGGPPARRLPRRPAELRRQRHPAQGPRAARAHRAGPRPGAARARLRRRRRRLRGGQPARRPRAAAPRRVGQGRRLRRRHPARGAAGALVGRPRGPPAVPAGPFHDPDHPARSQLNAVQQGRAS